MRKFRMTFILLILFNLLHRGNAQGASPNDYHGVVLPKNLTIVLGILSIVFSIAFILVVYSKLCQGPDSHHRPEPGAHLGLSLLRSNSRFSGIDQKVIDSLPFFRFSSLKGSKQGLECSVCLSRFEDIEILRLLPKCKHAFHIACIDHWLEKHSTCPLCRRRLTADDVAFFTFSNSMRQSDQLQEDPNLELFVQRDEDHNHNPSRFSIESSFRKSGKGSREEETLIQNEDVKGESEEEEEKMVYHNQKHTILVSEFVYMNRWSNLSSSDLMFLNTEMLGAMSSHRFSSLDSENNIQWTATRENERIAKIKEEMEMKRSFERRISIADKNSLVSMTGIPFPSVSNSNAGSSIMTNPNERRSVSDTTAFPRFGNFNEDLTRESSEIEANVKKERLRQIWLPIARRTVQWFANREHRSQQPDV